MPTTTVLSYALGAEEIAQLRPTFESRGYVLRPAKAGDLQRCAGPAILDTGPDLQAALKLCRGLKSTPGGREAPVLLLFDSQDPQALLAGFEAGADDCLARPIDPRVLAAHITAILRRFQRGRAAAQVLRAGPITLDLSAGQAAWLNRPLGLTATELLILELLMRRPGVTVLRRTILESLRGAAKETLSRAVDTHIFNLRKKLGSAGSRLLRTAPGIGYRLETI